MIAAQDIDALLISALYGELTPADEARLAVHLESHPTDRTALDDLTHARSVVRASRILQHQYEPPQAISALLLQEAARRAPRQVVHTEQQKESWFYRFTRSFMAHPAMAAAAMLVLVVGVAGTLYMKNGAQIAERAAPVAQSVQPVDPAAAAPHDDDGFSATQKDQAPAGAGHAYGVGSGSAWGADLADRKELAKGEAKADRSEDALAAPKMKLSRSTPAHEGMVVKTATPQLTPKELPPEAKKRPATGALDEQDSNHQEVAIGRGNAPGGAPANAAPPPAQPAMTAPASTPQRERSADKPAPDAAAIATNDTALLAWATDQHARVQALVKAGKCQDAAKLALEISAKAPEYYAQSVATDRSVKPCASYINDARDKDAEKSQKARAQKRVNANEPAPAPADLK